MRGTLQHQQAEALDAIDEAILTTLEPFRKGPAGYEVPMPAMLTAATRP